MKRDVFDGLKIEGLMEELKIPRYAAAGILQGIWALAAKFYPTGDIGRASNRQIAQRLEWPVRRADQLIEALVKTGWLDPLDGDSRLYIHDWHEHCDEYIHRVIARKQMFFANGSAPKLGSLGKDEKQAAESYYENKGLTTDLGAQSGHTVPPRARALVPVPVPVPVPLPARARATGPGAADSASPAPGPGAARTPAPAPTPTPAKRTRPPRPSDDAMRRWTADALAAKAAGLPVPPKPTADDVPASNLCDVLTQMVGGVTPPDGGISAPEPTPTDTADGPTPRTDATDDANAGEPDPTPGPGAKTPHRAFSEVADDASTVGEVETPATNQREPIQTDNTPNDAPQPASSEYLNALWRRTLAVTHDTKRWRRWWFDALRGIVAQRELHDALLEHLQYAEDCADPAVRQAKGLGELRNPGGWLKARLNEAAKRHGTPLAIAPGKDAAA